MEPLNEKKDIVLGVKHLVLFALALIVPLALLLRHQYNESHAFFSILFPALTNAVAGFFTGLDDKGHPTWKWVAWCGFGGAILGCAIAFMV